MALVCATLLLAVVYTVNHPGQITFNPLPSEPVTDSAITVSGTVENNRVESIVLNVNGASRTVSVHDGAFESKVALIPGENTIQALAGGVAANLIAGPTTKVVAQIPPSDIWVELTWDGPGDIDLHLYLPNGEHCFFQNKTTAAGAKLDFDNTERDGPEHITMQKAIPGEYRVTVLYYAPRETPPRPVSWTVTVRLKEGQSPQTYSGVLGAVNEEQTVSTFRFP